MPETTGGEFVTVKVFVLYTVPEFGSVIEKITLIVSELLSFLLKPPANVTTPVVEFILNLLVTSSPAPVDAFCIPKDKLSPVVLSSASTVTTVPPMANASENSPFVGFIVTLSGPFSIELASN